MGHKKKKTKAFTISKVSSSVHTHFYTFSCAMTWSIEKNFCIYRHISAETVLGTTLGGQTRYAQMNEY